MAFVQVETWSADAFQRIGTAPRPPKVWPWSGLMANGRDVKARRVVAVALSFALHIGAIWLILDKLASGIGEGEGQGRGDGIVMIDLSGMRSADSAPSPAGAVALPPAPTPVTSPVEASAPSDIFKPEWIVSKLRIATAQPVNVAATPPAIAGSVNGQVGSVGTGVGGGGQGYDPYAGASPQRRDPNVAMATGDARQAAGLGERVMGWLGYGAASEQLTLNQQAFEEATQAVKRALPGVRGRLEVSVRISSDGVILELEVRDMTLDAKIVKRMKSVLVGRKLFNIRSGKKGPHRVFLPTMNLS